MGRHGENIRKRKDGRWEARYPVGVDASGRTKYRSVYGKTYPEVKEKRQRCERELFLHPAAAVGAGRQKILFQGLMEEWLASIRGTVKESTYARYRELTVRHILPVLGEYRLNLLTEDILNEFLRGKLQSGRLDGKGGLSPKTVIDIRGVLVQSLVYARRNDYPAPSEERLFYPRPTKPQTNVLTDEEQKRLEAWIFSHPYPLEVGILTACYAGLRIGELCALQWKDFHPERRSLTVSKTVSRIHEISSAGRRSTRIVTDRPKTESSVREIPLPDFLADYLVGHRKDDEAYLLTGTDRLMEPRLCLQKYKRLLAKAGVRDATFHTLRHTFATRCVEIGFDTKTLSEILGHANVSTTLHRYVHPTMEMKRSQMNRLTQRGDEAVRESQAEIADRPGI